MTTPYTNLSAVLNQHLYKVPQIGSRPFHVHCAQRNPPVILTRKKEFFEGIAKFGFNDTVFSSPHLVWFPNQVVETKDTATSLVKLPKVIDVNYLWCTEYFHFFTEVLPNVLFVTNSNVKDPIVCKMSRFTEPAFRWFGITNDILPPPTPFKTEHLIPKYVECGSPSIQKINLLRTVIESKVRFDSTHGILIRRHGTRELVNEDEVFAYLQKTYPDLHWVIFDILSIDDTINLFSKASMIVGPHGAGMTNMLFSKKGVRILEIMPMSDPNICYWHLAEMLGHSYFMYPVPCDAQGSMSMDVSLFQMDAG